MLRAKGTQFLLVAGGTLVGLLLAEVALRVAGACQGIDYRLYLHELTNSVRIPPVILQRDRELVYRLRPNSQGVAITSDFRMHYRVNSKGLRDREHAYEKTPGQYRIVALGDSFTFGEGVEVGDRFTDIAEGGSPPTEIINMGVPGYGVDQSIGLLMREGIKYSPDHVMLFAGAANTRRHNMEILAKDGTPALRPATGTTYLRQDEPFYTKRDYWGPSGSHLFGFLSFLFRSHQLKATLENDDRRKWRQKLESLSPVKSLRPEFAETAKVRSRQLVTQLEKICRGIGAKLTVVSVDSEFIMDHLDVPGVEYIDFAPLLLERSKHTSLTFTYDQHFNPATNRFLGERLTEVVARAKKARKVLSKL